MQSRCIRRKRVPDRKVPLAQELSSGSIVLAPMYLARFYLPLRDNEGEPFPSLMFRVVEAELSRRFGGVTAHLESPASGLWREKGTTHVDEVVIFEVIVEEMDRSWWTSYRERLERDFRQKRILLMLQPVEVM